MPVFSEMVLGREYKILFPFSIEVEREKNPKTPKALLLLSGNLQKAGGSPGTARSCSFCCPCHVLLQGISVLLNLLKRGEWFSFPLQDFADLLCGPLTQFHPSRLCLFIFLSKLFSEMINASPGSAIPLMPSTRP